MTSATRYRINAPGVVHEIFDDEVVIIDFDSGSYFSLNRPGAAVWSLLLEGTSVARIVADMAQRYKADRTDIEEAVSQLLAELEQENLIVPDGAGGPEPDQEPVEASPETNRPALEILALQKFTDMQELLLLDPIHDVDDTGWPNLPDE